MIAFYIMIGVLIGITFMCLFQVNGIECLHCSKHEAVYCETCYQELIAENTRLQCEKQYLKEYIEDMENIKNFKMKDYKIKKADNGEIFKHVPSLY